MVHSRFLQAVEDPVAAARQVRQLYWPHQAGDLTVTPSAAYFEAPDTERVTVVWRLTPRSWAIEQALVWAATSGRTDLYGTLPVDRVSDGALETRGSSVVAAWLEEVEPFPVGTRVSVRESWGMFASGPGRIEEVQGTGPGRWWRVRMDDGQQVIAWLADMEPRLARTPRISGGGVRCAWDAVPETRDVTGCRAQSKRVTRRFGAVERPAEVSGGEAV